MRTGTSMYLWDPDGGISSLRESGLRVPGSKRITDALRYVLQSMHFGIYLFTGFEDHLKPPDTVLLRRISRIHTGNERKIVFLGANLQRARGDRRRRCSASTPTAKCARRRACATGAGCRERPSEGRGSVLIVATDRDDRRVLFDALDCAGVRRDLYGEGRRAGARVPRAGSADRSRRCSNSSTMRALRSRSAASFASTIRARRCR